MITKMQAQLSEVDGGSITYRPSLFAYFEPSLRNSPDEMAAVVMHQPSNHLERLVEDVRADRKASSPETNHLVWTYRELHSASVHFSNALLNAGVQPGHCTIMSMLPNGIEYFLAFWTSIIFKTALANIDTGVLQPPRKAELHSYLTMMPSEVIIVPDVASATAVDTALRQLALPLPKALLVTADSELLPSGWISLSNFVHSGRRHPTKTASDLENEAHEDDLNRTHSILFTSGTSTGKPKGVPNTVLSTMHFLEALVWFEANRNILQTANFRAIAFIMTITAWKVGGATIMPSAVFNSEAMLEAIETYKVQSLALVPYQFHNMVDHPKFATTDVSSVVTVAIGADMITKDVLLKCAERFRNTPNIIVAHGMTEGGGFFEVISGNIESRPFYGGIAPLGTIQKGTKLRVVDKQTGQITRRGEPGELHACSNSVVRAYLGGVKPEDFYTDEQGYWFKTGDQAIINDDGFVYIVGRIKDIIKRAGVPVVPAAIENCIGTVTKTESSVIGVPSPLLGQEPFAVIRSYGDTTEEQLKQLVIDEYGKDFALKGVASLEQLGLTDFPLNATGKIVKNELQEPVLKYLARTV